MSDASRSLYRTLLIVDDEEDILDSVRDLVEACFKRIRVETAPSAQRALEILKKGHVDMILSDYKMPGMNGLEFLREAARIDPTAARILFTAFADPELAKEAREIAQVVQMLSKPVQPKAMMKLIGTLDEAAPA